MPRSDTFPGHLRRRPSGSWRWEVSIHGERISEHWDANLTEREAQAKARERYGLLEAQRARGEGGTIRLKALMELFREEHLPGLAEASRAAYKTTLKALASYYGEDNPRIASIGRGDVKAFLSWRRVHGPDGRKRKKPLSAWSLQRSLAVVSALFEEALEREWVAANPARRISLDKPEREPVILTEEEYEELLRVVEERPMVRMYFLLGGEAGLRRSEAFDVRWSDLDLEDGFLEVVHGRDGRTTKGKRSRSVPMTARLRRELRGHAARFRMQTYGGKRSPYVLHHLTPRGKAVPGDPIARAHTTVTDAATDAELPDEWRFHDLRHRRCTLWLAAGYSPEKVRRAMGHASLATTLQYSHLVRSDLEEMVGEDADRSELADMVG